MQLHCSSLLSPLAFLALLRSLQGWIFVPQKFTPWSLSCAFLSPLCNFPLHSPYPSSPLFVSLLFPHFSLYPETYIMFSGDELIHKCPRSFIHKPLRENANAEYITGLEGTQLISTSWHIPICVTKRWPLVLPWQDCPEWFPQSPQCHLLPLSTPWQSFEVLLKSLFKFHTLRPKFQRTYIRNLLLWS